MDTDEIMLEITDKMDKSIENLEKNMDLWLHLNN